MGRTAELVLGIIGGVFGFFASIFAMTIGGIASAFGGGNQVILLGLSAMLFSIVGLVGGCITKGKKKIGGWMMIGSAIGGTISISGFFILPGLLFLIGGIMALVRKEGKK
jgi:hypothetical protein